MITFAERRKGEEREPEACAELPKHQATGRKLSPRSSAGEKCFATLKNRCEVDPDALQHASRSDEECEDQTSCELCPEKAKDSGSVP